MGAMSGCGDSPAVPADQGAGVDGPSTDADTPADDGVPDADDMGLPGEMGTPDEGPPDLGPQPRLTIGWGRAEYAPIEPGQAVELVRGPQRALHLEPAIRMENVDVEGLTLILRGSDADTGEPLTEPNDRLLTPRNVQVEGSVSTRVGNLLIFESRCQPEVIVRRVRVEAAVDVLGSETLASDRVEVVLVDEEMPDTQCPEAEE